MRRLVLILICLISALSLCACVSEERLAEKVEKAYWEGYNDGLNDADTDGAYWDGYNDGFNDADADGTYWDGYNDGYNDGLYGAEHGE